MSTSKLEDRPIHALWAFRENGEEALSDERKISILKQQGYAGFCGWQDQVADATVYEREGLLVPGLYLPIDPAAYTEGSWEELMESRSRHYSHASNIGSVWLVLVNGDQTKDKDEKAAIAVIREAAAWAEDRNKRVSLYPHSGGDDYCRNVHDALSYRQKAECKNVGVVLTMYHEVRCGNAETLEAVVEEAFPQLTFVCICGLVRHAASTFGGWRLTTLDNRDFDLVAPMRRLVQLGYGGPIGFYSQHFGGTSSDNLRKHMEAWKALIPEIREAKGDWR